MNIAGIVVHSLPENLDAVQSQLATIPGVEIHGASDKGKLILTIEHDDHPEIVEAINKVSSTDGVINAAMVYQHSENIPSEQEATL